MAKRATGRTYRLALKACLAASEGKKVLWAVSGSERREVESHLVGMANPVVSVSTRNRLEFPGGGSIRVFDIASYARGIKVDHVIYDALPGAAFPDIENFQRTVDPSATRISGD